MSFTYDLSGFERDWIQSERQERMRNDECYAIDAKYSGYSSKDSAKTIPFSKSVSVCDECKETFEGAPFMVRGDGLFKICFCGTTCCTDWMKRHAG